MIAVIGAVAIVALLMLLGVLNATGFFRALPLLLLLCVLSFVAGMVAKVNLGPAWTPWAGLGAPAALLLWAAWRPGSSRAKLWIMSGASLAMNSLKWLALIACGLTLPANGFHLDARLAVGGAGGRRMGRAGGGGPHHDTICGPRTGWRRLSAYAVGSGPRQERRVEEGWNMSVILTTLLLAMVDPCVGSTTPEVERCLAADLARADAELNRYYRAAVERLTRERETATLGKLRASERAWMTYRDAECDAVYDWWGRGTIRGAMALGCRIRLTEGRTMVVWRNWLTYADSTPPILSKPGSAN